MIRQILPGVSTTKLPSGTRVTAIHYTADPMKDAMWVKAVSHAIGGEEGIESAKWKLEMEMDVDAGRDLMPYHAFSVNRNVVPWFEIPKDWDIYMSADWGHTDETCILFWARHPKSGCLYIWDEIYLSPGRQNVEMNEIKEMACFKLVEWYNRAWNGLRSIHLDDLRRGGSDQIAARNPSDPQGVGYMHFFAQEPFPLFFQGNPEHGKWKLNDRGYAEARINSLCKPSFVCCGRRQVSRGHSEQGRCEALTLGDMGRRKECGKVHASRPRFMILGHPKDDGSLDPCAPNLVKQYLTIRRKKPNDPLAPIGEKNILIADHAADSSHYGILRDPVEMLAFPKSQIEKIVEKEPHKRTLSEHASKERRGDVEDESKGADDVPLLQSGYGYDGGWPNQPDSGWDFY